MNNPIFLVGFMGSGKSTIGALLAKQLNAPFIDLDDDIEAAAGCTIAEVFERDGEPRFRDLEHDALAKRVDDGGAAVIALGGGAFTFARNRDVMQGKGTSVWLDCPFDTALRRVEGFAHRPLAKDPEKFRALFESRRAEYAKAEISISITSDDPADAVRDILKALR